MSANVLEFDVFVGSAKGLLARPLFPNNSILTRANVAGITYQVFDTSTPGPAIFTGTLDPQVVMFTSPQKWKYDGDGYTFFWVTNGSLWPVAGKSYRIVIWTTIQMPGNQMDGALFAMVYQANAKNPAGG